VNRPAADAALIQRRLFRLTAAARGPLAFTTLFTIASGTCAAAQMMAAAAAILAVFPGGSRSDVPHALGLLMLLIGARAAFAGLAEWSAQHLATRIKSALRLQAIRCLVSAGPIRPVGQHTGELAISVLEGIDKLDPFYRRFVPQVMATVVMPAIVLAAVAWFDLFSALILALTAPLIPVFMWLLGTLAERRARDQWMALSLLGGRFLDTVQGLDTLQLFGRAEAGALGITAASEQLRTRTMGVLKVAFLSGFVLELAASVSTAVLAATVGVRLLEGTLTFAAGLPVLLLAPEFYLPFRQLGQRHHAAMEGTAAAQRVFELLDQSHEDQSVAASRPLLKGDGELVVDRLSYRYPGSDRDSLSDVSFVLAPRTMTAVVGPSGSGKSTLLALILRFITPGGGSLRLNGRDARDVDAATWRTQVAYVPQRPTFVRGTILENLRLGRPDASYEEVVAASRLADADAFIRSLPDRYKAAIDETASALSGGERQRLALARALVKEAPLLILDEPTASVDEITESVMARTLTEISRTRTVLVVAHRRNTIKHADLTLVFEAGRLVERRTRVVA
jgi:ATP-binding cassette subfamily C protein CydD